GAQKRRAPARAPAAADAGALPQEEVVSAFKRLARAERLPAAPAPVEGGGERDPADRVFAQVNRPFPLQVAGRWLAATTPGGGAWPRYDAVSDRVADDAATVGSLLEQWDADAGRKRDELLATGLPRRGNSSSRDRFLSQFLARVTRGGQAQPGAACHYLLTAFQGDRLALTSQGVAFAQIKNPVLDTADRAAF